MATGTNLPNIKPLDSSELEKEWPKWKQTFLLFLKAAKRNDDSEEDKLSTLLYSIGEHGRAIFNVLFPNDGSLDTMFTKPVEQSVPGTEGGEEKVIVPVKITLKEVIEAFDRHCSPAKSTTMEAFKFNSTVQKEKQSFVEFETKLRTQIQYCAFDCSKCKTSYADRMLLDRIVTGVYDKKLQLRLLDGETKSLAQIISMSKSFEAASKNKQILEKNNVGPAEIKSIEVNEVDSNKVDAIKRLSCFNCGRVFNDQHRRVCPARNIKYQADHALKVGSLRNVKIVSNNLSVGRIRWYKIVTIQDCKIKFKIDTESDPNCINIGFIKKINVPIEEVSEVSDLVLDYSSNEVKVFDDVFEPILGLETCIKFGIVKRIDTIEEFPTDSVEFVKRNKDIFDGLGTIPGKCSIVLKENSTPTLHYKKRFPLSVHEKLKCELEALKRDGFASDRETSREGVAHSDNDSQGAPEYPPDANNHYRTRYGREVRQPKRYGTYVFILSITIVKQWKSDGPEQQLLEKMFDDGSIQDWETPSSVQASHPMFKPFSERVFANHFRATKSKMGYDYNATPRCVNEEHSSIPELGRATPKTQSRSTDSNLNEKVPHAITHNNVPCWTWVYTEHDLKKDFVCVAIPALCRTNAKFSISEDGGQITIKYVWPQVMLKPSELFSKYVSNGKAIAKSHPKVHSFISHLNDWLHRELINDRRYNDKLAEKSAARKWFVENGKTGRFRHQNDIFGIFGIPKIIDYCRCRHFP
ncbi:hypothetical protein Bhyg_03035 [Pseudolycoriella hygida]|uniref:Uncharacterized protein n=1 Tax=Pseudolycoriella hygida TaxID=35572 RepID=A0A9Q0S742_9DIPT|nr:hypothetical protein Bhyg_03035 [Pseudolycoriella hygida]